MRRFTSLLLLLPLVVGLLRADPVRYALKGTVITPQGPLTDGIVVVHGSHIESVGTTAPASVAVYETGGILCPGFLDLHNHLTWNVFPRWSYLHKFPNRYEWQQLPEYLMALAGPHETLIQRGDGPAMARYGEVKALVGGATSLAGLYPGDLEPGFKPPYHGLIRMLDLGSGFYTDGRPEGIRYEVFPFFIEESQAEEIRTGLKTHTLHSLLVHLGEGSPVDAGSINEFRMLKARGLLLPGVTLIHGVALHEEQLREMAALGVGLVWSPRSNFELYGQTAEVALAKRLGVRIALAPDWSPTGSDGVIEELRYAAVWNAAQPEAVFTDRELVDMATTVPATLTGVSAYAGSIQPGLAADLLVLKREGSDPYHAIVHADPTGILLAVIDGKPVYGTREAAVSLAPQETWSEISVSGVSRCLALPKDARFGSWQALTLHLDAELHQVGSHLGPLAGN